MKINLADYENFVDLRKFRRYAGKADTTGRGSDAGCLAGR